MESFVGYDNAKIIALEDVWCSMSWQRINTTNGNKMPTRASNLIDLKVTNFPNRFYRVSQQ